ncbi:probable cytochrome P450 313a4 [Calliphora vicina]|uniref:probable cytochrome P450 313a4 n=1 Tax=Calliphora vicina TaxID=7373 RepID=UPI00325BA60C
MEIALETIMGVELNTKHSDELVAKMHTLMENISLETALSPMKLGFIVRTSSYYKILEYLQTFLKSIISRKAADVTNQGCEFFLNRALKYQQQGLFQARDTITETYTMISGSYETTSTTLYSLIVMLAMHPLVQEKLYQDVIEIIPATDAIVYEHLEQLPYLQMVLSETLRLVPPIPFIGREALESCTLTKDLTIPRDFQILIPIFHLHRSTTLWGANAHKFNPDNFLDAEKDRRHPYAYVPYSKGVRNCIGWRYADISLKFVLLGLLRQYKFVTSFAYEDLYFVQKISLQYLREPKIKIIKRN